MPGKANNKSPLVQNQNEDLVYVENSFKIAKGVIRSHKSKKSHYNVQTKNDKAMSHLLQLIVNLQQLFIGTKCLLQSGVNQPFFTIFSVIWT